jgi:hypothetical protein
MVFGIDPLTNYPGYWPVFSLARFTDFHIRALSDLLRSWDYFGWHGVLLVWAILFYLAWRRHRPALRFCWIFMAVTPLPIEFLEGRGNACLYIPLAGWAVFAAVVFTDLALSVAGFLEHVPIFRRLGRRGLLALIVAVGVFFWAHENRRLQQSSVKPAMDGLGRLTWEVIQQFRALDPRVRHGAQVVFLSDPFTDYDMTFIAELWFRDRSLTIWLQRFDMLPASKLAQMDYLFAFEDGRLVQVR